MPYLFEFEPAQSILRCTLSGHIDDKTLLECRKAAVRHVQQTNPAVAILDLTPISSIDVSPGTVQALARSDPAFPASRPKLIIAPSDHLYGMSRMYQLIGEQIRPSLQVVRSLAEAYAALDVAELHFSPVPES
jgi:ABC-type transporter Mla MlaB component